MRLHRDSNEMHVIFHEAICPYLQGIFAAVEFEPIQILKIIFISFKYCLPIVAPLGDMMRITYRYSTGYSWHGRYLKATRLKMSRKIVAVPISVPQFGRLLQIGQFRGVILIIQALATWREPWWRFQTFLIQIPWRVLI